MWEERCETLASGRDSCRSQELTAAMVTCTTPTQGHSHKSSERSPGIGLWGGVGGLKWECVWREEHLLEVWENMG